MAVNLNALAQSLPANNYKLDGGLGGAVSGMQIADYLDNRERGTRSDDLEYETKQNELMNALADNPQKELARQLALTKGGAEQDLFKTGLPQQAAKLKLEDEIKTIQMKEGPRALDKLEEQSRYWEALSEAHSRGVLDQHRDLFVKQGAALGLPPVNFNDPNLGATLAKYKQRAVETRDVLGRLRVQKQQQDWQGGENRENRASAERIAGTKNTGWKQSSNPDYNIINEIVHKAKQGEPINEHDINRLAIANENRIKATAGDSLETRNALEKAWIINKNNKKDRPASHALYSNEKEYASAVIAEERANRVTEQVMAQLNGAPLVVQGQVVGQIDESTRDVVKAVIRKQSLGDFTNGKTGGAVGAGAGKVSQSAGQNQGAKGAPPVQVDLDKRLTDIHKALGTDDPKKVLEALRRSDQTNTTKALIKKLEDEAKPTQKVKAETAAPTPPKPKHDVRVGLERGLDLVKKEIQKLAAKPNRSVREEEDLKTLFNSMADISKKLEQPDPYDPNSFQGNVFPSSGPMIRPQ